MITPLGIELKVGQKWRELHSGNRIVEIVALFEPDRVRIKFVRTTHAQLRRFNGKRGGYSPA